MSTPPYTYKKPSGAYYFQIKRPDHLAGVTDPNTGKPLPSLIRKSLSTHDRREAATHAAQLANYYHALFQQLSTGAAPEELSTRPSQAYRKTVADPIAVYGHRGVRIMVEQEVRQLLHRARETYPSDGSWIVRDSLMDAPTLAVPAKLPEDVLPDPVIKQIINDTAAEKPFESLEKLRETKPPRPIRKPLKALLAELIQVRKPDEVREKAYKTVLKAYEKGFLKRSGYAPDDLSKDKLMKYKDKYLEDHKVSTWNNNHATVFNMLIKLAYEDDYLGKLFSVTVGADEVKAVRRLQGLPVHDTSGETRRAATDEEIQVMRGLKPVQEYPQFFEFLLATGMRANEAAQLKASDLIRTPDDGLFVRVTDTEGRRVKNQSSIRSVPVPPQFVKAFEAVATGEYLLDLPATTNRSRANVFIQAFSRSKIKAGLEEQVTLHSLRHTWKLKARAAGIPAEVSDYLTGHSAGKNKVAMDYGQGYDSVYSVLRGASEAVLAELRCNL